MTIADRAVLVTGANRGIGQADMNRGLDIPKASPEAVARAIFDGLENGEEDIFPDPTPESLAERWRGGAVKALERQNAAVVAAGPFAA